MLQDILLNAKKKLQEVNIISEQQIDELIMIIKRYKINRIIYPGIIMRELNIDVEKAYRLLGIFVSEGILEMNYEVYCHYCSKFIGKIYRSLASIPEEFYCDQCERELSKLHDTILIFRVITDVRG